MPVDLTLGKSAPGRVKREVSVTFTAGMDQEYVGDHYVDMSQLDWRFTADQPVAPDTESVVADTLGCDSRGGRTCNRTMLHSGTMYASAYVNGVQLQKSVHVDVKQPPRITLEVSSDSVVAGDTVYVSTTFINADADSVETYDNGAAPLAYRGRVVPLATRIMTRGIKPSGPMRAVTSSGTPCLGTTPAPDHCYIIADATGTLSVTGLADSVQLSASKLIKVRADSLKLICNPASFLRGAAVTCTASDANGRPVTATGWSFASTDPILPSFTYSRTDGTVSSSTWSGRVALSGTVSVSAMLRGTSASAQATVTANARDWSGKTVEYAITPITTILADPPATEHQLGSNSLGANTTLRGLVVVTEGPNTDLVFFDDLPFKAVFDVQYNSNAMRDSSMFQRMQPATRTGTMCSKADVTGFISLVKAHEGFSITDPNSHSDVYKRSFQDSTRVPIERSVQRSTGANVEAIRSAADLWAAAESQRITDDTTPGGTNPFQATCVFNYNPAQSYP